MATFTARGLAARLVQIQKAESVYRTLTIAMRRDATKTVADTLWRRYKRYQRMPSFEGIGFLEWLVKEEHMENTFWHGGSGLSLPVRRRMAIRYREFFSRKELHLEEAEGVYPDAWARVALEALLNLKDPQDDWEIVVMEEECPAIPAHGLKKSGLAYTFVREESSGCDKGYWLDRYEAALDETWA